MYIKLHQQKLDVTIKTVKCQSPNMYTFCSLRKAVRKNTLVLEVWGSAYIQKWQTQFLKLRICYMDVLLELLDGTILLEYIHLCPSVHGPPISYASTVSSVCLLNTNILQ